MLVSRTMLRAADIRYHSWHHAQRFLRAIHGPSKSLVYFSIRSCSRNQGGTEEKKSSYRRRGKTTRKHGSNGSRKLNITLRGASIHSVSDLIELLQAKVAGKAARVPSAGYIASQLEWLAEPNADLEAVRRIPDLWESLQSVSLVTPICAQRTIEALVAWARREPDASATCLATLRAVLSSSIRSAVAGRPKGLEAVVVNNINGQDVSVPVVVLPNRWGDVFRVASVEAASIAGSGDAALAVLRGALRLGAWPNEQLMRGVIQGLARSGRREDAARVLDLAPWLGQPGYSLASAVEEWGLATPRAAGDAAAGEWEAASGASVASQPAGVPSWIWAGMDEGLRIMLGGLLEARRPVGRMWLQTVEGAALGQDAKSRLPQDAAACPSEEVLRALLRGQAEVRRGGGSVLTAAASGHAELSGGWEQPGSAPKSAVNMLNGVDVAATAATAPGSGLLRTLRLEAVSHAAVTEGAAAGEQRSVSVDATSFTLAEAVLSDHSVLQAVLERFLSEAVRAQAQDEDPARGAERRDRLLRHAARLVRQGLQPHSGQGVLLPHARKAIAACGGSGTSSMSVWAVGRPSRAMEKKWGKEAWAQEKQPTFAVPRPLEALLHAAGLCKMDSAAAGSRWQRAADEVASLAVAEASRLQSGQDASWDRVKRKHSSTYLLDTASKQGGTDYGTRGVVGAGLARRLGLPEEQAATEGAGRGDDAPTSDSEAPAQGLVLHLAELGLRGGILEGLRGLGEEADQEDDASRAPPMDTTRTVAPHPLHEARGLAVGERSFLPLLEAALGAGRSTALLELGRAAQSGAVPSAALRRASLALENTVQNRPPVATAAAMSALVGAPGVQPWAPRSQQAMAAQVSKGWSIGVGAEAVVEQGERQNGSGRLECPACAVRAASQARNTEQLGQESDLQAALDTVQAYLAAPSAAGLAVSGGRPHSVQAVGEGEPTARAAASAVQQLRGAAMRPGMAGSSGCFGLQGQLGRVTAVLPPSAALGLLHLAAQPVSGDVELSGARVSPSIQSSVPAGGALTREKGLWQAEVCWGAFGELLDAAAGAKGGGAGGCVREVRAVLDFAIERVDAAVALKGGTVAAALELGEGGRRAAKGSVVRLSGRKGEHHGDMGGLPAGEGASDIVEPQPRLFFLHDGAPDAGRAVLAGGLAGLPLSVAALAVAASSAVRGNQLEGLWTTEMSRRAVLLAAGSQRATGALASAALAGDLAMVWQLLLLEGVPAGGALPQLPTILAAVRGWR